MNALLLALAAYRVTRLLITDAILDGPRHAVHRRLDPAGKLHYLVTCYWCLGLWVSAAMVLAFKLWPTPTCWAALALAISTAVGLIAEKS